jgi:hypothetical protein
MDKLSVRLIQQEDYRFEILFSDELPPITGDEPPPLGKSEGIPNLFSVNSRKE